jgi:hypothetical protein
MDNLFLLLKLRNETVFIERVSECSNRWPNWDTCAAVLISAFVSPFEDVFIGRELSYDKMSAMWSKYGTTEYFTTVKVSRMR